MSSYIERMEVESNELHEKLDSLRLFMRTEKFHALEGIERLDLREQAYTMANYAEVLDKRLARAKGWIKPTRNNQLNPETEGY